MWNALVVSATLAAAGCGGQDTNGPKTPSAADGGANLDEKASREAPDRAQKEPASHDHEH
jgi:hypothetical protein